MQCVLACGICGELCHRNDGCREHQGMDAYGTHLTIVARFVCLFHTTWVVWEWGYIPDPEDTGTMVPLLVIR